MGETMPITTSSTAAVSRSWRVRRLQRAGQQVDGLDFVQAAVLLALAARRADGVEHKRFGHRGNSLGGYRAKMAV
jgi:hypothetical protein